MGQAERKAAEEAKAREAEAEAGQAKQITRPFNTYAVNKVNVQICMHVEHRYCSHNDYTVALYDYTYTFA